jgi:hypothetical protein
MMLAATQVLVLVLLLMQLLLHALALQAVGVGVQTASSRSTGPSLASSRVHTLANHCCEKSALC